MNTDVLNQIPSADDERQRLIDEALRAQFQARQIERENQALEQLASVDALTGLANRAKWDAFFPVAFAQAQNLKRPLAVLFVDMDRFKSINDTYGHQVGDAVLQRTGAILREFIRPGNLAARYGGEELTLALSGADRSVAIRVAEQIRHAIMQQRIRVDQTTLQVTASIGVAAYDGRNVFTFAAELLRAADSAVYAAKNAGRNRVHASDLTQIH